MYIYIVVPFEGTEPFQREALYARAVAKIEKTPLPDRNNPGLMTTYCAMPRSNSLMYGLRQTPRALLRLSMAIINLDLADGLFFCKGWSKDKNCQLLVKVAQAYGKECIFE